MKKQNRQDPVKSDHSVRPLAAGPDPVGVPAKQEDEAGGEAPAGRAEKTGSTVRSTSVKPETLPGKGPAIQNKTGRVSADAAGVASGAAGVASGSAGDASASASAAANNAALNSAPVVTPNLAGTDPLAEAATQKAGRRGSKGKSTAGTKKNVGNRSPQRPPRIRIKKVQKRSPNGPIPGRKATELRQTIRGLASSPSFSLLLFAICSSCFRLVWPGLCYAVNFFNRTPIAGYAVGQVIRLVMLYLVPLLLLKDFFAGRPERLTGAGKTNLHTVLQTALTGVIAAVFLRGLHNLSVYAVTNMGFLVLDKGLSPYPAFHSPAAFLTAFFIQVPAAGILETLLFCGLLSTGRVKPGGQGIRLTLLALLAALGSVFAWTGITPFLLCLLTLRLRFIYDDLKVALSFNLTVRLILLLLQFIVPRFDSNYIFLELTSSRVSLWVSLLFVVVGGFALYLNWSDVEKYAHSGNKLTRQAKREKAALRKAALKKLNSRKATGKAAGKREKAGFRTPGGLLKALKRLPSAWYIALLILLLSLFLARFLAV